MPGFQIFLMFLHHFVIAKLPTRFKDILYSNVENEEDVLL